MNTVAVIDYGMGNVRSVCKALAHVSDARVILTSDPKELLARIASCFPGRGP